jgi:DNA-binding CsgD family transcriptional regulator
MNLNRSQITQEDINRALKRANSKELNGKDISDVNEIKQRIDKRSLNKGDKNSYFSHSERKYDLAKLNDLHYQIIRYIALGKRNKDIADLLDINTETVSRIRNNEMTALVLKAIRKDMNVEVANVAKEIAETSKLAIEVMKDAVEGNLNGITAKDRINASKDILDRAGYTPVKKTANINTNISSSRIKSVKAKIGSLDHIVSESAKRAAQDVDFKSVEE